MRSRSRERENIQTSPLTNTQSVSANFADSRTPSPRKSPTSFDKGSKNWEPKLENSGHGLGRWSLLVIGFCLVALMDQGVEEGFVWC